MAHEFSRRFTAGWGDMDFNGHMRNTAFLDLSGTTRMMYFQEHGFSMREFEKLRFGPVIVRDELTYFKELRLLEEFTVTVALAGLSSDNVRFRFRNTFIKDDGKIAATVTSTGGWLSLEARRLAPPPDSLGAVLNALARTNDFEELKPPPAKDAAP